MLLLAKNSTLPKLTRNGRLFLGGALLGVLVFVLVFEVSTLDVTNDAFCRGGYIEKDIQQHYAGWLFYRQSSAGWPLCIARGINYPDGLSVAYTDSIPLVAALLKPVANLVGGTFQYMGWFTLVCFALQGGFGALLAGLFLPGCAAPLAADLLFVTSPILFERVFRHTSLGAQFFVLAALYFYFAARRKGQYASRGLFALNALAVGIHPYFLPMTYAITLALLLEYALHNRQLAGPGLYLAANFGGTALLGWALGLLYGSASSGGQALYGYFCMNLNALWNPVGVNGVLYSRVLPAQNQVYGNYDAFAYLGLGVLIALPIAVVLLRRQLGGMLRRHWALACCCAVLTVFAISNVITANGATLATLPLPASLIKLFSIFRSSGRLFWPIYYLLMLLTLVGLARLKGRGLLAGAALLAVVQAWDVSPGMVQRSAAMLQAMQTDAFPTEMESDFWQAAQRETLLAELAAGTVREDTLYLFAEEGAFLPAVEPVKDNAWCGRVTSTDGTCSWYVIAPGLQGQNFDALCTPYDENYPLRLADYTDALWNRGVLDETKQTVCFADSPFVRRKLEHASVLCADGKEYTIKTIDDHDAGWLMVTLDIPDATVLWDKELESK